MSEYVFVKGHPHARIGNSFECVSSVVATKDARAPRSLRTQTSFGSAHHGHRRLFIPPSLTAFASSACFVAIRPFANPACVIAVRRRRSLAGSRIVVQCASTYGTYVAYHNLQARHPTTRANCSNAAKSLSLGGGGGCSSPTATAIAVRALRVFSPTRRNRNSAT